MLRKYQPEDCVALSKLFYETVHAVNSRDYNKQQLNVWADGNVDLEKWNKKFLEYYTVVAVVDDIIVGFGNIAETGYLDKLYIHKDYQRKGIATAICDELEKNSFADRIITYASITSKPFFEQRGYRLINEREAEINGIKLKNYIMEKEKDK